MHKLYKRYQQPQVLLPITRLAPLYRYLVDLLNRRAVVAASRAASAGEASGGATGCAARCTALRRVEFPVCQRASTTEIWTGRERNATEL